MAVTILIADDDPVHRRLIENMVRHCGYHAISVDSGDAAVALLTRETMQPIDAIVLDLVMPGLDGMGVLAAMREAGLAIPVIVQTAHGGIDNVISAMQAGAHDFVVKPVGIERLQVSLRNALSASAVKSELRRIRHSRAGKLTFSYIVTRSRAMDNVLAAARKAASSTIPVLIEGESGVGKELIARAVHGSGERAGKPFVAVNCNAIPDNLVESILFGHAKGAFPGDTDRQAGKFAEADGGTLFLDRVGELPLPAQARLVRALQDGRVEPIGGRKAIPVDVRIVSATDRDLIEEVKAGRFLDDLFYRLHVLPLTVPPLRARRDDIPHLLRHFLARIAVEENRTISGIDGEAMAMLMHADWPGNIRQLENAVYRAVALSESDTLTPADFAHLAAAATVPVAPAVEPLIMASLHSPPTAPAAVAEPARAPGLMTMLTAEGEIRPLDELEAEIIRFAFSHYRGQMSEVARRLKIGRSTLYRKLDNFADETPPL